MKKIFISSDQAGFNLKEIIKKFLSKKRLKFYDLGPYINNKVDYPDFAHKVAKKVKVKGKIFSSIRQVAKYYKVSSGTLAGKLSRGIPINKALGI